VDVTEKSWNFFFVFLRKKNTFDIKRTYQKTSLSIKKHIDVKKK